MLSSKLGDYKSIPTNILVSNTASIKQVSAGASFVCILLDNGEIYCWGSNALNQCGKKETSEKEIVESPTIVEGVKDVVEISCGGDHTLCLTKNGTVIVFGSNQYGQLGLGKEVVSSTPTELPLPVKIRKIAAGLNHSLLLGENNTVYCCGYSGNTNVFTFCEIFSMKEGIDTIYAGGNSSMVVINTSQVYMWGNNLPNSLSYTKYPQAIDLKGSQLVQVSLGCTHSCLYLYNYQTDLMESISHLNGAELQTLNNWHPRNVINRFNPIENVLSASDALLVLLAYLSLSNRIFFENQKSETKQIDSNCFLMKVTYESAFHTYDMISHFLKMYFDTCKVKQEKTGNQSSTARKRSKSESVQTTTSKLLRPPSKSFSASARAANSRSSSISRSGSVSNEGKEQSDFELNEDDFEMDERELMQIDVKVYQSIDHKHQVKRSHFIDASCEDKNVLFMLYSCLELFYAQELFYNHSKHKTTIPYFKITSDEPTPLILLLFQILEIDSNSTEISLIKKKAIDIFCGIIIFIDDINPLNILIDMLFKEYEQIKENPKLDKFSLIDTILLLLKFMKKENLFERLISNDSCDSFVKLLQKIFNNLSIIFSSYIRVLSSDQHDLDISGITEVVHFILKLIFSIYNNDFAKALRNDKEAIADMKNHGASLINVCNCVFKFSQQILECFVETVTWEDNISTQLADFFVSSPVYRNIEYILYMCYSFVLHIANSTQSVSESLEAVIIENMKAVCSLLEPLSQIVILENRCINLFESRSGIEIRRFGFIVSCIEKICEWMKHCSSVCSLFATAVTSALIQQSSSPGRTLKVNKDLDNVLKSVLLTRGVEQDLKDSVRSQCLEILENTKSGLKWFDSIPKKKKLTAMDLRLLNKDKSVMDIVRYVTAVHIWHSPLAYTAIRSGNTIGQPVIDASTFAYWVLTYVNSIHQQQNLSYTMIRDKIQNMCSFLLNVMPLWYVTDMSQLDKSITNTYQLLRNRKEIVLDEDEDEDEDEEKDDIPTVVNDTIMQLVKRFILSKVNIEELDEAITTRTNDAQRRATSIKYFSSMMSRAQNEEILDNLTNSIAWILEQTEADGSISKIYFNSGLEGSNQVYIEAIRNAFCSIIQSSMRRVNSLYKGEESENSIEKMINIIYSLALPYLPSDASLLQQSGLLKSLFQYWSFMSCFYYSRYTSHIIRESNMIYITGCLEGQSIQPNSNMVTMPMWTSRRLSKSILQITFVQNSLFALLNNGLVVKMTPQEVRAITPATLPIKFIAGSVMGGHLTMISQDNNVYSTGANDMYQCGRISTSETQCTELKTMSGTSNGCAIQKTACGLKHTILLGAEEVFGCGDNSQFALGISATLAKTTVELRMLRRKEIVFIACGDYFSLFASKNHLYGTGSNKHGQLGANPKTTPFVKTITEIELPEKVREEHIAGIAAGSNHMVLWTGEGSLFVMGRNNCGQLGLGHRNDVCVLTEVVNMNVQFVACGGDSTLLEFNHAIWGMGANDNGQLGVTTPKMALYPILCLALFQESSHCIAVGSTVSSVIMETLSFDWTTGFTSNSLKMSYFVWLFMSMLFGYCSKDQLELSDFSQDFLRTVLREIYALSQWVGNRCVDDEWDMVSPLSTREGSVGMITHILANLGNSSSNPEANAVPFTYINQLLTILVVNARQSEGVVNVLREPSSLNVLLPLLIQLLNLYEMISVSMQCQFIHLDDMPYTTPLLLCIHNLTSLLSLLLIRLSPSVVSNCLTQEVSPVVLSSLAPQVEDSPKNSLFPYILLRQMGRVVMIPYGPNYTLIPAPYFSRLIASKCIDLVWVLLDSREWKDCITNSVFSLSSFVFNSTNIIPALSRQPVDLSVLNHLYYLVGPIMFYAGFQTIPMVDCPIAVTISTMRQEGRVILFRDRKQERDWKGSCLVKLSSSKELVWVSNNNELTLIKSQIPIDDYTMISRVFDNYSYLLNLSSTSHASQKSPVFCEILEMVMYSIMQLLQFPLITSQISLSSIRSVVNYVHVAVPFQYSSASTEQLQERQLLVEGLWRMQLWNSIGRSLTVTATADYTVNVWPPSLTDGTHRCEVCDYPNPQNSRTCALCGAPSGTTLAQLVVAEERGESKQQIDATPSSTDTRDVAEDSMDANLESSCKWMFIESIRNPPSASCSVNGKEVWDIIGLKEQQKKVLKLSPKTFLSLENPFMNSREGLYLNVWTIIMDVIVPDFAMREYTCLLQTDPLNKHPGSFFVRKDGSCGIGVYSQPGVIKNNCIHRIIISADLPHQVIRWYVDGAKRGELSPQTLPGAKILIDDRWSIDEKFHVGADCSPVCMGTIMMFSLQLRRKLVTDREAMQIGAMTIEGPPEPNNEDTINSLVQELKVPRSYCVIALNAVGWSNERNCKQWIEKNKENVNQILISEAKGLEMIGYSSNVSKRLILFYGNRQQALENPNQLDLTKLEENDPALQPYLELMKTKKDLSNTSSNIHHPGVLSENRYTCCGRGPDAPGCTTGNGRSIGIIKVGDRVGQGMSWRWGNQNNGGFGTVINICAWDTYPMKGVKVKWDNGFVGLYRWNLNGAYDLVVINEVSENMGMSLVSYYGNDSSEDNPSFEIVNDIQSKFKDVHTKKATRFLDISDCTLSEVRQELCIAARALCSSFSRIALLNLLSLTNDKSSDKISTYSLFMDSRQNLFQSFLSAFVHDLRTSVTDMVPQQVLKKEVSKLLENEVHEANEIVKKNSDVTVRNQNFHAMWNRSFSRRMYFNLLCEISLMAAPTISIMQSTLSLQATSSYKLIAKYPECGVSFWMPYHSKFTPLATVINCADSSQLGFPPSEYTYVVDLTRKGDKSSENFARPIKYEQFCVLKTATGGMIYVWQMIPPMNFAAFGMVVTNSADPPSLSDYVCIRRSLLELAQAVPVENADEMHVVPYTFWTSNSIIRHFFVSTTQDPPDSHLVVSLQGETQSDSDSIEQIGWMLDTFSHIVDDPSRSMGDLTPFIFRSNIVTGLFSSFKNASPEHRSLIINYMTTSIRQMYADAVTPEMKSVIADLNVTMETLYSQQKGGDMFSPSFQALIEVLVSVKLMCYDSRKKGFVVQAEEVEKVMSKNQYFTDISEIAVIMESLCHRKTHVLPLEYIMEPFLLYILVRLRRSQLLESEHPYQDVSHHQKVMFPDASSLTLRFSPECCSEEDDVFAM